MFGKSWIWKCWNWVNSIEFQQQCKMGQVSKFANSIYIDVIYNSWIWIPNLNFIFSNEFYSQTLPNIVEDTYRDIEKNVRMCGGARQ